MLTAICANWPQRDIEVAAQTSLQRRAVSELTAKCRRCHAPGRPGALHQGVERCSAYPEHQRDPQHAFVAHEADFETAVAIDRSDQRDEAVGGEEDMANGLAGLAEHLGKAQLDLLATCQQMLTILTG
jgi:hypothetical protein